MGRAGKEVSLGLEHRRGVSNQPGASGKTSWRRRECLNLKGRVEITKVKEWRRELQTEGLGSKRGQTSEEAQGAEESTGV